MTMHPDDRLLNDYVDGGLDSAAREDVERHLERCEVCRQLVNDLLNLTAVAQSLEGLPPPEEVFTKIERVVRQRSAARRQSWWIVTAAAAAFAGAVWVGVKLGPTPPRPAPVVSPPLASVEAELQQAEQHYLNAIDALQQVATTQSSTLDPMTLATLQKNLVLIDQAITESRAAVRAQPGNNQAETALLENLRVKLSVLNDTVTLITEYQQGHKG